MPIPNRLVVLLAEDNENDVLLIRRAFKRLGNLARLVVVPDGSQLMAYLRGDGNYSNRSSWPIPDVVLIDQNMPRMSGLDVLSWIRTEPRYSSMPVVVLSGGLSPRETEQASQLRAALCQKGVTPQELIETIGHAVGSALGLNRVSKSEERTELGWRNSLFGIAEPIRIWT